MSTDMSFFPVYFIIKNFGQLFVHIKNKYKAIDLIDDSTILQPRCSGYSTPGSQITDQIY